ncbi:hypothetical protein HPP92_001631 [Vanilla planifolia]|uniref:Uncharacterized protein n=1 Tax=Vanilla planifolia TaxID=51239 RepID=A0A835RR10_VANPL|nr:hypothetical protein HPP92_001631 [Vanilla planifolia]
MTRESHDVHRNIPGAAAVASPPPSPAAGGKQTQPVAKGNESQSVLKRLQSELMALMAKPNNESPLNTQAAALWGNQEEFKKVVESSTSLRD